MIKVGNTTVTKVQVDGGELNYVKLGDDYIYARPCTLTYTQTNCTYRVKRTASREPTAPLTTLSSGATIYFGDTLIIENLTPSFGYKNATTNPSGTITVSGDLSITSSATKMVAFTLSRSSNWYASVAGGVTQLGYRLKNANGTIIKSDNWANAGTVTVYATELINAYTIELFGLWDGTYYVTKTISIDRTATTYTSPENATYTVGIGLGTITGWYGSFDTEASGTTSSSNLVSTTVSGPRSMFFNWTADLGSAYGDFSGAPFYTTLSGSDVSGFYGNNQRIGFYTNAEGTAGKATGSFMYKCERKGVFQIGRYNSGWPDSRYDLGVRTQPAMWFDSKIVNNLLSIHADCYLKYSSVGGSYKSAKILRIGYYELYASPSGSNVYCFNS